MFNGHTKIVEILINQENIDINAINNIKNTPLLIAVKEQKINIIKILINQENIDVNCQD